MLLCMPADAHRLAGWPGLLVVKMIRRMGARCPQLHTADGAHRPLQAKKEAKESSHKHKKHKKHKSRRD